MSEHIIDPSVVEADNARHEANLRADYDSLGERLDRRGIAIDEIKAKVEKTAGLVLDTANSILGQVKDRMKK